MAALEVIITINLRVVVKSTWLRELEKDCETITWLHCEIEKTP